MTFISQFDDKDREELRKRIAVTFPFWYYPISELTIEQNTIDGQQGRYFVVRSQTQGLYKVTDFECAVIQGSSEAAGAIKNVVKTYLTEKHPDDYPYFYNKNLTKKLEEERIK